MSNSLHQIPSLEETLRVVEQGLQQQINLKSADKNEVLEFRIDGQNQAVTVACQVVGDTDFLERWSAVNVRRFDRGGNEWIVAECFPDEALQVFLLVVETALKIANAKQLLFQHALKQALKEVRDGVSLEPEPDENVLLGLLGELLVLQCLIRHFGWEKSLQFWHESERVLQDFCLPNCDIEVKTTKQSERVHIVSSLGQLEANENRDLYLFSLHLAEGAKGIPAAHNLDVLLSEMLSSAEENGLDSQFRDRLKKVLSAEMFNRLIRGSLETGWYQLRDQPKLIKVDESFPRIALSTLNLDKQLSVRLRQVEYEIDVFGLGESCPLEQSEGWPIW